MYSAVTNNQVLYSQAKGRGRKEALRISENPHNLWALEQITCCSAHCCTTVPQRWWIFKVRLQNLQENSRRHYTSDDNTKSSFHRLLTTSSGGIWISQLWTASFETQTNKRKAFAQHIWPCLALPFTCLSESSGQAQLWLSSHFQPPVFVTLIKS